MKKENVQDYQMGRLIGCSTVVDLCQELMEEMQAAENITADYYGANPNSYAVLYTTDEYIEKITEMIKQIRTQNAAHESSKGGQSNG